MDEHLVAATLAAAVLAKTELGAKKDPVATAAYIYQRTLRSVRKVHQSEDGALAAEADAVDDAAAPVRGKTGAKPKKGEAASVAGRLGRLLQREQPIGSQ